MSVTQCYLVTNVTHVIRVVTIELTGSYVSDTVLFSHECHTCYSGCTQCYLVTNVTHVIRVVYPFASFSSD